MDRAALGQLDQEKRILENLALHKKGREFALY